MLSQQLPLKLSRQARETLRSFLISTSLPRAQLEYQQFRHQERSTRHKLCLII